jgi:probable phosphoglycerate mutase
MTDERTPRLLIVRHGETDMNKNAQMQGHNAVALNETGRRQLSRTARRLEFEDIDVVYASDFVRAQESAGIITARNGIEIRTDTRLREQDLGDWEGRVWFDLPEDEVGRFIGDLDFAPGGGETKRSVRERVRGFLGDMVERHAGETVLIVTHGGPLTVMIYDILGIPFGPTNLFYVRNGGLSEIEWADDHWRLITLDEVHFLED